MAPSPTPPPGASPGPSVHPAIVPATVRASSDPNTKATRLVPPTANSATAQSPDVPSFTNFAPAGTGRPHPEEPNPGEAQPGHMNTANSPSDPNNGSPVVQNPPPSQHSEQDPSNPSPNSGGHGVTDPEASAGNTHPTPSVVANGNTIVRDPVGGVVIASSTYTPGQTAQIPDGTPISVGSDHVIVGGSLYALPAASQTPAPIAAHSIVRASDGGIVIGSTSIALGAHESVAGHTVSVGASNAVVDDSTYALPTSAGAIAHQPSPSLPAQTLLLVNGQSVIRDSNGAVVVGGSTAAPGQEGTVAGHIISVVPSASIAAVDGTTYALATSLGAVAEQMPRQRPNIAQNLQANSKLTLANGAVISAGGSPATVSGTVLAIPSDDSGIIVNGKTTPLLLLPGSAPTSVFSVASQAFTAAPTGFVVGTQSLSPGGSAITLSGTPISLGASRQLQIGTSAISLPSAPAITSVFTIAGQTFTASPTAFPIGSQTLGEGGSAITLSGTMVSLGSAGLVIGSSTIPLTPAEQSEDVDVGLGGLIVGGGQSSASASLSGLSGPVAFTGGSSRTSRSIGTITLAFLTGVSVAVVALVG